MNDNTNEFHIKTVKHGADGRFIAEVGPCPDETPTMADPGWQRGPYNPNHEEGTAE